MNKFLQLKQDPMTQQPLLMKMERY